MVDLYACSSNALLTRHQADELKHFKGSHEAWPPQGPTAPPGRPVPLQFGETPRHQTTA
jgi:hypothetical protein